MITNRRALGSTGLQPDRTFIESWVQIEPFSVWNLENSEPIFRGKRVGNEWFVQRLRTCLGFDKRSWGKLKPATKETDRCQLKKWKSASLIMKS